MAKVEEVRLTLAALIYSIESDLKYLINWYITPCFQTTDFLPSGDVLSKTIARFEKDNNGIDPLTCLDDLVEYLDFGDILSTLNKNSHFLPQDIHKELKNVHKSIEDIIPIRNRVMHTRPLIVGDFGDVYGFVSSLHKSNQQMWSNTIATIAKIENDPQYVLTIKIPFLQEDSSVHHNLPYPDFDETGFVGRTADLEYVKKLLRTNSVVSIIGDGGVGKTALAIKAAYDLIDQKNLCPFEIIIWVSAKTTMLTAKGIDSIHNTITTYSQLIEAIDASTSEKPVPTLTPEEKISNIFECMAVFPTLLIIDNLETIHTEEVRRFIREAQEHCTILITSRVGLGELEYPRRLSGLNDREAVTLIREVAKARGSSLLIQLNNSELVKIASKLYYNPLGIKWFVSAVETGLTPNEVLLNKHDLLNFCLSNVIDKLSLQAKHIINTIRAARRAVNISEIVFLTQFAPETVRNHINELFRTTLISREIQNRNDNEDIKFALSEFAKDYLAKVDKLDNEFVLGITKSLHSLRIDNTSSVVLGKFNEYDLRVITTSTSDEKVVARILREALELSRTSYIEAAIQKTEEAKSILPHFSESYRVAAFIKGSSGDWLNAIEDYELALEINPKNKKALYYYAQLLLYKLGDHTQAFELAQKLLRLEPTDLYPHLLMCRCYAKLNQFDLALASLQNPPCLIAEAKLERIVATERITTLYELMKYKIRIEENYQSAIIAFENMHETFSHLLEVNNYDAKVIKNYADGFSSFLSLIPYMYIDERKEWLQNLFLRHKLRLSSTPLFPRICELLEYKHRIPLTSDEFTGSQDNPDRYRGRIIRKHGQETRAFTFIECDNGERYFAHIGQFIDLGQLEWRLLKDGQWVEFDLGQNREGPCAVNVRLLESTT